MFLNYNNCNLKCPAGVEVGKLGVGLVMDRLVAEPKILLLNFINPVEWVSKYFQLMFLGFWLFLGMILKKV